MDTSCVILVGKESGRPGVNESNLAWLNRDTLSTVCCHGHTSTSARGSRSPHFAQADGSRQRARESIVSAAVSQTEQGVGILHCSFNRLRCVWYDVVVSGLDPRVCALGEEVGGMVGSDSFLGVCVRDSRGEPDTSIGRLTS